MTYIGRLEILNIARLINRFRLSAYPEEIYDSVISNYDTLLEIIENHRSAVKLALTADMPISKIRESAEAILDFLIFNKKNDPFVSLGLKGNEDRIKITRRWRQLITLFHPDKYPGNRIYEERAKRINEAYEEIRGLKFVKKEGFYSESRKNQILKNIESPLALSNRVKKRRLSIRKADSYLLSYLRYLPFFITVFMALISLTLLFLLFKKFF